VFGHLPELAIVLVIALIVFGPEKLPEVMGSVGKVVRELRSTMDMALDQQDHPVPDDFSTYYREAQMRSGEPIMDDIYESEPVEVDAEPGVAVAPDVAAEPDEAAEPPV